MPIHDNLSAPDVIADPYPYFHQLRAEDPVHWNPQWGGWILTRYDDVQASFQDRRLSADRMSPFMAGLKKAEAQELQPSYQIFSKWMVFTDPPQHTRLRMLVNKAFTPRRVEGLRPRIQAVVDELLDRVIPAGQMELIHDFAYLLPVTVIAELLGVPARDHENIKKWSDEITLFIFGAIGVPDRRQRAQLAMVEMAKYLKAVIAERRQQPQDDLISALIAAQEQDDALTDDEIVSTCSLVLFGGHETTTNLISSSVHALLKNPAQKQKLTENPDLISTAVEEFLRYDGPSKSMVRLALEDFELRGKQIKKGQRLLLFQSAANHDPERFPDPDSLDVARQPNPHVAFGYGIHFCLGAPLARIETAITVNTILRRLPKLRLATDTLEWHPTIVSRALKTLPVAFS
ncbi:MAG: cytochrome P450 [Deltaproteobacteria bacterium]|nr:cytochrome P450 [Deltaproteobacteria bacterium]